MPLFELKSLCRSCVLEDPAADCRAARRVGQYRVSGRAFYVAAFPGTKYLPFAGLTRVKTRNTALNVTGCCGKTLPMVCLRAFYDGEFYQDFLFEKQAEADRVLDAIRAVRPDLPLDLETQPLTCI